MTKSSTSDARHQSTARAAHDRSKPAQPLKLKTYQAWTMAEALAFVKQDLGEDAVILHTRTFERGGFFGFGRKAVVEITATRAADMPDARSTRQRETNSATAPVSDVRASAAARAYEMSLQSASRAADRAAREQLLADRPSVASRAELDRAEVGRAKGKGLEFNRGERPAHEMVGDSSQSAQSLSQVSSSGAPAVSEGPVLDMDREREKTRRLAQAMAIQLERQQATRDIAARNEMATERRAATPSSRTDVAQRDAVTAKPTASHALPSVPPSPLTVTTEPAGPAQRFVLVPEATSSSNAAHGTRAMVAAVVREPTPRVTASVGSAVRDMKGPDAKSVSLNEMSPEHAPAVAPESAPTQSAATTRGLELDAIDAFVRRVLTASSASSASSPSSANSVASTDPAPTRFAAPTAAHIAAQAAGPASATRPALFEEAFSRLIEQEVSRELADRIMADVEREVAQHLEEAGAKESGAAVVDGRAGANRHGSHSAATQKLIREAVERRIAALLPADDSDGFRILPGRHGRARRIAFVGPTGVGKTTTLAKIAAQLTLKRGLRVGIVAADTYRIAAVDQLRTYAEILGIAVEVASSPADAARACERLGEVDVVLIDTAGRSQNDRMKLSELKAFLAAAEPDETHLVLSATAGARTLAKEAESFSALGADRLVLTKLDEAASFGTLVGLVERLGTRVSFFTHGQEVPDHIEVAQARRLAALVMGSEVR
jgi:flagellar biosynthesis protein FlhF